MMKTKPAMGWNTWNTFGKNINEKLMLETVDKLVSDGYADAGYEYIVIDDIWALKQRDKNGYLVPDPEKFPLGMKYIADYIHSKGLKFGMYSCAGYLTCAGYPASYGYEWKDAESFAKWGVDFLKYDFCFRPMTVDPDILYKRMGLALKNCGRDILFSACSWGSENTKMWIKETGADMWRSTGDINDSWQSIKSLAQSQLTCMEYNGAGCFNDMDMLIVGMNGKGNVAVTGCTAEEYKLHFSFWAMMNSPLMMGCDIRCADEEAKKILLNKDVIAINQDPDVRSPFFANQFRFERNTNGRPGDKFYTDYPLDIPILAKYLDGGDIAIGFFNFTDTDAGEWHLTMPFDKIGLSVESGKTLEYTDLWTGEKGRAVNGTIRLEKCAAHSCILLRAKVVDA